MVDVVVEVDVVKEVKTSHDRYTHETCKCECVCVMQQDYNKLVMKDDRTTDHTTLREDHTHLHWIHRIPDDTQDVKSREYGFSEVNLKGGGGRNN